MSDFVVWTNTHNVRIEVPLASIGNRILAYLVDWLIRWAFIIVLAYFVFGLFVIEPSPWFILIIVTPYLFYSLLFEQFNDGQSPGKRICQIKVTSPTGQPVGGQSFFLRWVFRLIDFSIISPVVALIAAASSKQRQRIGDMVANTVVVDTKVLGRALYETYTTLPESYVPLHPEAKNLSRTDISLIKAIMKMEMGPAKDNLIHKVYSKLVETHGILSKDPPKRLLFSLVMDYNYYKINEK